MRVYRIPYSTNVERIALALGYKQVDVDWVEVPAEDRSEVVRVSGQELVPVLDDRGQIVSDSEAILRYLGGTTPGTAALATRPRSVRRPTCSWTGSTACGSVRRT